MKRDYYYVKGSKEFFSAVKMGDIIMILKFLRGNGELANDRDKLQRTPLHWAARRGYDKVVEMLVDFGAEVQVVDSFGKSPVEMALEQEYRDIAKVT